jgi:hypothetical protein
LEVRGQRISIEVKRPPVEPQSRAEDHGKSHRISGLVAVKRETPAVLRLEIRDLVFSRINLKKAAKRLCN